MKFTGTDSYVASDDLRVAVNAAIALQRPLLIKGEPGTGKTVLAHEVAKALKNERVVALWKEKAADAGGEPPAEFNKRVHAECQKWAKVVAGAGSV